VGTLRITTLTSATVSGSPTATTVGLTTYTMADESDARPRQTITLYARLLDELSDEAATGVIAHELAHAWLNEHEGPEDSRRREQQADDLARNWGFGEELAALDREAYTLNG
jgi:SprT-like family